MSFTENIDSVESQKNDKNEREKIERDLSQQGITDSDIAKIIEAMGDKYKLKKRPRFSIVKFAIKGIIAFLCLSFFLFQFKMFFTLSHKHTSFVSVFAPFLVLVVEFFVLRYFYKKLKNSQSPVSVLPSSSEGATE